MASVDSLSIADRALPLPCQFYETALIQEVTRPHPGSRGDSDSRSCWKKWQLYTFNKEVWGEMAAISRTQYPLVIYIIEKMA